MNLDLMTGTGTGVIAVLAVMEFAERRRQCATRQLLREELAAALAEDGSIRAAIRLEITERLGSCPLIAPRRKCTR